MRKFGLKTKIAAAVVVCGAVGGTVAFTPVSSFFAEKTATADFWIQQAALGAGLRLNEIFVRGRTGIGDQTNASRMTRQRIYMESAASRFKSLASANKSFINTFLDTLEEVLITDMSRGRMFNELNRAYKYKLLPIERLEGEYSIGKDGFKQFNADDEYISAWVLANLYRINK